MSTMSYHFSGTRLTSIRLLSYYYPMCNIAIILGVLMGHRGLKTGIKFAMPGLLLCAVTCVAYLGVFYLYQLPKFAIATYQAHQEGISVIQQPHFWGNALMYLAFITIVLGIFLGYKGLKTSERNVAKLGLRLCWLFCWIICFWNLLWLSSC